jgi:hypothetical protein
LAPVSNENSFPVPRKFNGDITKPGGVIINFLREILLNSQWEDVDLKEC